jgi:hypothetical protein
MGCLCLLVGWLAGRESVISFYSLDESGAMIESAADRAHFWGSWDRLLLGSRGNQKGGESKDFFLKKGD